MRSIWALSLIALYATGSKGADEELNAEDEVVQMEVTVQGTSQVLDPVARPLNSPEFGKRKEAQKKSMEIIAEAERRRLAGQMIIHLQYADSGPKYKPSVEIAAGATVGDLRKTAGMPGDLSLWHSGKLLVPESEELANAGVVAETIVRASLCNGYAFWTRKKAGSKEWKRTIERDPGGFYEKTPGGITRDDDAMKLRLDEIHKQLQRKHGIREFRMSPPAITANTQAVAIFWEVDPVPSS